MLSPFNIIRDSGFLVCRFKWTSTASSRTRFMYSSNPKNLTFSSVYWVIFLQSNLFACLFKSNKAQNGGSDEARSTWYITWPQRRFKADYLKTLKTITLKGVFAKNERGYRLNALKKRFWWLLILLLSVALIKRKLLKTTYTEELNVHTNWESCNTWLGS